MERRVAIRIQIKVGADTRIGHGKIRLLEEIGKTGSISGAARTLGMSFRRGWELIDQMNRGLGKPVVTATAGALGGADVTSLGRDLIARFRAVEANVEQIAIPDLQAIDHWIEEGCTGAAKSSADAKPHKPQKSVQQGSSNENSQPPIMPTRTY